MVLNDEYDSPVLSSIEDGHFKHIEAKTLLGQKLIYVRAHNWFSTSSTSKNEFLNLENVSYCWNNSQKVHPETLM